jgi:hypothetical protein
MMERPIAGAEEATPEWLTAALYQQGVLHQGHVTQVMASPPEAGFSSLTWRLLLSYSSDASSNVPGRLFLKCSRADLVPGETDTDKVRREIDYYQRLAPLMMRSPSVPCYAAAYDPHAETSHLLLLDVSETHNACVDPCHPENPQRAVRALARLHAFWWDHPRLESLVGELPTQERLHADWADGARRTEAFVEMLGDRLPRHWRDTYARVLRSLPNLCRRHLSGQNLTLVHGDAHLGNYLFSRTPNVDETYIIDWQFWHATIGGTDLAFMMAAKWEPEIRRRMERPLLQRYYDTLLEQGVSGYPWDQCWDDYRLSVILVSIFIPVWQWSLFGWQADLLAVERGMRALDELGCAELLDA